MRCAQQLYHCRASEYYVAASGAEDVVFVLCWLESPEWPINRLFLWLTFL